MQNLMNTAPDVPVTEYDRLYTAWKTLTMRELEVACAIAEGRTNHDIVADLGIGLKTYDTHRGHVLAKLGARHNVDVCRIAIKIGAVIVRPLPIPSGN
jgi:DNA-binding CsgD family transcriptional regulator